MIGIGTIYRKLTEEHERLRGVLLSKIRTDSLDELRYGKGYLDGLSAAAILIEKELSKESNGKPD